MTTLQRIQPDGEILLAGREFRWQFESRSPLEQPSTSPIGPRGRCRSKWAVGLRDHAALSVDEGDEDLEVARGRSARLQEESDECDATRRGHTGSDSVAT